MKLDPQKIATAAASAAVSQQALEDAIREQHVAGMSLRQLAALTGLSHETIRRMCSRPTTPGTTGIQK